MLPADVQAGHPQAGDRSARPPSRRSPTTISRSCGSTRARSWRSCRRPTKTKYRELLKSSSTAGAAAGAAPAHRWPSFGPSKSTAKKESEKSYILTSGDPDAAREEPRGGARLAVRAGDRRLPRRPDRGVLRLADRAGESAVRARGRESPLAVALRRGSAEDAERFRQLGGAPAQSGRCSTGWRRSSSSAASA